MLFGLCRKNAKKIDMDRIYVDAVTMVESGTTLRPHRFIQLLQHRIQLLPQHLVHLFGPAVIGEAVIYELPVDDDFVHQLLGQTFEPSALIRVQLCWMRMRSMAWATRCSKEISGSPRAARRM